MPDPRNLVKRDFDITKDNASNLPRIAYGFYIDVAGTVRVELVDHPVGTVSDYAALAAGVWHPMEVRKVWSTGTTATGMKGGWDP